MTATKNNAVKLSFDADTGIATLTIELEGRTNVINDAFVEGLTGGLEWAKGQDGLKGICLATGHRDFCVGAEIDGLYEARDVKALTARVEELDLLFRSFETCGVPVVAMLTGSAIGGGCELAMSCHHRIALNNPGVQVGLPEVGLGLLPGAGGTQRLPRLIGIQPAMEMILQGRILRSDKAFEKGLVNALADGPEDMRTQAEAWIAGNTDITQPWDRKGFRYPGFQPNTELARNTFMGAAAMVTKKTAGAMRAPQLALSAIQEGVGLDFDAALQVETRYFVQLAASDQAKDMIRTLWFHRRAAEKHAGLPSTEEMGIQKVAILGAGMMGAGLAFVCAQRGFDVVLKDINQEALDKAEAHVKEQVGKRLRHLDDAGKAEVLGRIDMTLDLSAIEGCDLVIEAVVENLKVKHAVTKETEGLLSPNGIWASNTSAIPITDLARASAHDDRFIGLHFFSPVEQMPLLELIMGENTSEDTLARCLAFTKVIKKLPIVVNDGYGFFTSRMFSSYILEGAQLVAEGHDPVVIEWAARRAGMVVSPLQVFDEVTLSLGVHAMSQAKEYLDRPVIEGVDLVHDLVQAGRTGKAAGAGFYDYGDEGRSMWPGLQDFATKYHDGPPAETGVELLQKRLMLAQCAEVALAREEGILRQDRDAEVGAIFGLGFAPNTGGPLSYMDRMGITKVVEELTALAEKYGERYKPAPNLVAMAEKGERFFPKV